MDQCLSGDTLRFEHRQHRQVRPGQEAPLLYVARSAAVDGRPLSELLPSPQRSEPAAWRAKENSPRREPWVRRSNQTQAPTILAYARRKSVPQHVVACIMLRWLMLAYAITAVLHMLTS